MADQQPWHPLEENITLQVISLINRWGDMAPGGSRKTARSAIPLIPLPLGEVGRRPGEGVKDSCLLDYSTIADHADFFLNYQLLMVMDFFYRPHPLIPLPDAR
jgi:hypothetical protein